ncbi:unnamed protein product [Cercospora beticola]|nr:unnamed protein product [Cercospora beticola]
MGVSKLLGVAASIAIAFAMQNAEHVAPETMRNSLSKKQDAAPLKMMLVGDSITHGFEADTTWRFRLWEWLKSTNTPFNFVGPYTGVCAPMPNHPPQPPRLMELPAQGLEVLDEFPRIEWGYAKEVPSDFDAHHFATSGEKAERVQGLILARVEEFEPEMLLILLGFNDLSWGGARPEELLERIKTIVDKARANRANTKFIIGNVVHEQLADADLEARTSAYNELLNATYSSWSTVDSPVHYADVAGVYTCGPNRNCTSTVDGLHPNDLGAYQIAHAFSQAFIDHYAIGQQPVQIPDTWTDRAVDPPTNIKAFGSSMGITVTWDRPFGIPDFNVRRRSGDEDWITEYGVGMNRSDTILPHAGIQYEYQVRSCLGQRCGEWSSESVTAVSDRRTGPPPRNVRTKPTALGFEVSWSPPKDADEWNITQYDVAYANRMRNNLQLHAGTRKQSAKLEGLESGQYSIIGFILDVSVSIWTDPEGGSLFTFGRPVRPGTTQAPQAPSQLRSEIVNETAVHLTWEADDHWAGFLAYVDHHSDDIVIYDRSTVVAIDSTVATQIPEICISAINGDLESKRSCLFEKPKSKWSWRADGPTAIIVYVILACCLATALVLAMRFRKNLKGRMRGRGMRDLEQRSLDSGSQTKGGEVVSIVATTKA